MTKNTNHCVKAYAWMCKSSVHVALRVHAGYSANCPGCFMLATLAVSSTTTYVALSPSCCLLVMSVTHSSERVQTDRLAELIRALLPLFFRSPVA